MSYLLLATDLSVLGKDDSGPRNILYINDKGSVGPRQMTTVVLEMSYLLLTINLLVLGKYNSGLRNILVTADKGYIGPRHMTIVVLYIS